MQSASLDVNIHRRVLYVHIWSQSSNPKNEAKLVKNDTHCYFFFSFIMFFFFFSDEISSVWFLFKDFT